MAGRHWYLAGGVWLLALCQACTSSKDVDSTLSKQEAAAPPKVGPIPKDNPKLGSIADITPVFEEPDSKAKRLGYLHAGARVARAKEPYSDEGCEEGWYPIRPRGFVCVGASASLDMKHPTLQAMSLDPELNQALPYTYARTVKETPLFEQAPARGDAVKQVGKLRAGSGLAVVGSWNAKDEDGNTVQYSTSQMPGANLLFSPPGASLLALIPGQKYSDFFYDLCCHNDRKYFCAHVSSRSAAARDEPFAIDPAVTERALEALGV